MRRFLRSFLVPFLLLAIPLGILAGLGFVAAHRQLLRTRDAAVVRTVDAVNALVTDYQESLRRETILLAGDPAVVEGTVGEDVTIIDGTADIRSGATVKNVNSINGTIDRAQVKRALEKGSVPIDPSEYFI